MTINKKSKNAEAYASTYKSSNRWESNRRKKLLKQQKLQPNNKNIPLALTNIHYRRCTPKTKVWSASAITTAKLFKLFSGRYDPKLLNPANNDLLHVPGSVALTYKAPASFFKSFFSIEARLFTGAVY